MTYMFNEIMHCTTHDDVCKTSPAIPFIYVQSTFNYDRIQHLIQRECILNSPTRILTQSKHVSPRHGTIIFPSASYNEQRPRTIITAVVAVLCAPPMHIWNVCIVSGHADSRYNAKLEIPKISFIPNAISSWNTLFPAPQTVNTSPNRERERLQTDKVYLLVLE